MRMGIGIEMHAGLFGLIFQYELSNHYHPSVTKFAQQVLAGQAIAYDGNPLLDFSTKAFLDRFMYELSVINIY